MARTGSKKHRRILDRDLVVDLVVDWLPLISLVAIAFGLPALLWGSYQLWGTTGTLIVATVAIVIAGSGMAITRRASSQ